jgi:hypothetical protein
VVFTKPYFSQFNYPLLSAILNVTREESFFFHTVKVALGTAWFIDVSNATPFSVPFCEKASADKKRIGIKVIISLIAKI